MKRPSPPARHDGGRADLAVELPFGLDREVLEFEHGVRAYAPAAETGYWRIRWEEAGRRRDTTARSRSDAIAKAGELVERLGRGTATDLARASGADLVAHYLDPARRPARVEHWSERHREEQGRYCSRFVLPLLGAVPCRRMTRLDFKAVLDQAPTPSVASHLTRCLIAWWPPGWRRVTSWPARTCCGACVGVLRRGVRPTSSRDWR